ncbi:MAG: transglycosylase SLT domain-containing protein [Candidatus Promineifilaceae bacterium]
MTSPQWDDHQAVATSEIVQRRFIILLIWVIVMMGLSIAVVSQLYDGAALPILNNVADSPPQEISGTGLVQSSSNGIISPIFTREVQQWAPQIGEWSRTYGADVNQIATIMQIESCGDPYAESWVGAQGLFQVMPFHFEAHENMKDPDTNARRGINYFNERMAQTNGDVGRSFAGYNGGHGASGSPYDQWAAETQSYFYWATGIYEDAVAGKQISERLDEWMTAGGYSLCQQASTSLGLR